MLLVTDKWSSLSDALSAELSFHHLLMSALGALVIMSGPTLTRRVSMEFNIPKYGPQLSWVWDAVGPPLLTLFVFYAGHQAADYHQMVAEIEATLILRPTIEFRY